MQVEIELRTSDSSYDIYSLRTSLEENFDGLRLEVQTQPVQEGQMDLTALGMGIVHGLWHEFGSEGTKVLVQQGKKLYKHVREWQKQHRKENVSAATEPASESLTPGITMGDGTNKVYITEDRLGNIQVFDNFNFAVPTEYTYALLIGNSEFDGNFPSIPPVRNNLIDFYNLLTDKRHIGLPRKNVEVLLNKTNNEIEELLLKTSRKPDMQTMLIYYTGHGHKAEINQLVLTARNTKKVGDDIIGGIDFNFITDKVLKRSTAQQKILILDACHSGLATQGSADLLDNFDVKGTYILTSSGDEASYFEKHAKHTFFTDSLLALFDQGITDDSKEMISLEDMYDFSFQRLVSDKFPEPHRKSLLNISPSLFYIARNPGFSEEKFKQRPLKLMAEGKAEEAYAEYVKLVRRYPDDDLLRKRKDECQDQVTAIQLTHDGDDFFYKHANYKAAAERYRKSLDYKDDISVVRKLRKCQEMMADNKSEMGTPVPDIVPPAPTPPVVTAPIKKAEEVKKPEPKIDLPVAAPANVAAPAQEVYQFSDEIATITFAGQPDRVPKEIVYKKINSIRYVLNSNQVTVRYVEGASAILTHDFKLAAKENALELRNFLVSKTGLKKQKVKREAAKIILSCIGLYGVFCAVYIGIIGWAKSYALEQATKNMFSESRGTGIISGIASILSAIGSFITPTVAIVITAIMIVIVTISALADQQKKIADEVYLP